VGGGGGLEASRAMNESKQQQATPGAGPSLHKRPCCAGWAAHGCAGQRSASAAAAAAAAAADLTEGSW
jgi:hypothetical protein